GARAGQFRWHTQPARPGGGCRHHRAACRAQQAGGNLLLVDGTTHGQHVQHRRDLPRCTVSVIRAFRSEGLKMLRPSIILGGAGTMCGFAILAVVLRLSRLGGTHIGPGTDLTAAMVAASDGFAPLIVYTAPFLGLVALAVCAAAVGTEYSNGTLR